MPLIRPKPETNTLARVKSTYIPPPKPDKPPKLYAPAQGGVRMRNGGLVKGKK